MISMMKKSFEIFKKNYKAIIAFFVLYTLALNSLTLLLPFEVQDIGVGLSAESIGVDLSAEEILKITAFTLEENFKIIASTFLMIFIGVLFYFSIYNALFKAIKGQSITFNDFMHPLRPKISLRIGVHIFLRALIITLPLIIIIFFIIDSVGSGTFLFTIVLFILLIVASIIIIYYSLRLSIYGSFLFFSYADNESDSFEKHALQVKTNFMKNKKINKIIMFWILISILIVPFTLNIFLSMLSSIFITPLTIIFMGLAYDSIQKETMELNAKKTLDINLNKKELIDADAQKSIVEELNLDSKEPEGQDTTDSDHNKD